ncbi:unnamed protein product [Ectocarpus sp. CCAP 1310/34]|nr:unnamed protein product [Ectocarpus sp. CCAP 1310/34]
MNNRNKETQHRGRRQYKGHIYIKEYSLQQGGKQGATTSVGYIVRHECCLGGPSRFYSSARSPCVLAAKHVVEKLLQFSFYTRVMDNMLEEVKNAPLPILHHMIDIWTEKSIGAQGALGEAKAAEVLFEIFKAILHEFGLRPSDIASGTTDSGSDVKSVSINGLHPHYGVLWNWCFCHLMVKTAEDGFGTHVDPQKSKNPEARDMLKNVISIVGNLHRSSNLKANFDDLQPLSSVTRDGQYEGAPMLADIHMKFGVLKMDVLDPSKDLKVFDVPPLGAGGLPDRNDQKKLLPHKMLTAEEGEYLPAGSDVIVPTSDEDVQEKLDETWAEIKKRAVTAVKKAQSRAVGDGGNGEAGPFKRARTSGAGPSRRKNHDDAFAVFGRNEVAPQSSNEEDLDLVEKGVSSEIMRYKGVFMRSTDLPPSKVLHYWKTVGKHSFPSLKYVAQQTLGSQASAPQVERGFSHCGLFCVGNRKFSGKNDDLLKAEMALDPLSNTTPPQEDDVGVGEDG